MGVNIGTQREERKRGARRRARSTTEPGGVRGERRAEEGPFIQKKGSLLLIEEEKEKLLLASWTQCQTQSVSGLAGLLVSQAPAHNGGEPRPPHLSLPICVLQDRPESRGLRGGTTMHLKYVQILIKKCPCAENWIN